MLKRSLLFSALLPPLYFGCVLLFSAIRVGDTTVMKISTRNPVTPGGAGFTFQRFQDIESYRNIDILFAGSSHSYRTFDPRVYEAAGFSAFNMGSSGQTPLNSYYLIRRYFPQLKPKLVVIEVYYDLYHRDGLESFYDLVANTPWSLQVAQMGLAIRSWHSINEIAAKWLHNWLGMNEMIAQQPQEGERYIAGGYVEYVELRDPDYRPPTAPIAEKLQVSATQLHYLEQIIEFVQTQGARVLLVMQPEPPATLAQVANYDEITGHFHRIAVRHGAEFIDFNRRPAFLQAEMHYYDREYLNRRGAQLFNETLATWIAEAGYLASGPL